MRKVGNALQDIGEAGFVGFDALFESRDLVFEGSDFVGNGGEFGGLFRGQCGFFLFPLSCPMR